MSTNPTETSFRFTEDAKVARLEPSFVAERASHMRATSRADFPNAPTVSKKAFTSMIPPSGTEPGVSFSAYKAAAAAGETTEPDVSVPRETGAKPHATPTADPVDEPAGVYTSSQSGVHEEDLLVPPTVSPRDFSPISYPVGIYAGSHIPPMADHPLTPLATSIRSRLGGGSPPWCYWHLLQPHKFLWNC